MRYTRFVAASHSDSPAARLRLALDLFAAGEALMLQNLRRRFPTADDEEIEAHLAVWLRERSGADHGDAEGVAITWPRTSR